jgi:hypothetical protein
VVRNFLQPGLAQIPRRELAATLPALCPVMLQESHLAQPAPLQVLPPAPGWNGNPRDA